MKTFKNLRRAGSMLVLLTAALFWNGTASAQTTQVPKTVSDIQVEFVGDQSVSEDRILSSMAIKPGDPFTQSAVDNDIQNLYKSGLFDNIRILSQPAGGNTVDVIVQVQARSIVGRVSFRGNTEFSDSRLLEKVELRPGDVASETAVQTGQRAIQKLYRDNGYSEVTVAYDRQSSSQGYTDVIYKIDEGGKSMLREIEFVGNTAFDAGELREQMQSREVSLLGRFTNRGRLNNDQLEDDLAAIEDYYRDRGYLNARVVDARRVRVDDRRVDVVITIEEGEVYTVSNVDIVGPSAVSTADLVPFVKSAAGETFSGQKVEDDIEAIRNYYGDRGFADVRVTPQLESAGGNDVAVTYDIFEGEKYYIGKINIEGNTKTKDIVLRRELAVEPGDLYRTPRISASKKRLQNTNYFETVDVLPVETNDPQYKDLNISVQERPTGTFNFGAGFSSIDNFVGFVEVTQTNFDITNWPNFTGGGQRFRAAIRAGSERRDAVVGITEPFFLGRRLSFGTEVFYRDLLFLSDVYEQTNYGLNFTLRKPIGEYTHLQGRYEIQNVEIGGIDPNASDIIKAEEGEYLDSTLGLDWIYDDRDDIFIPRNGRRITAGVAYSGLGGDVDAFQAELGGIQYFSLPWDTIFSLEGHIKGVSGDDVPIFKREFLGGANNLRGFDYRDVGPKDETGEPIGGLTSAYATAEYTFPIIRQLRGAVFYDVGMVSADEFDFSGDVNSNFGIGIRLYLPVGPLRLDYGIPMQADEFNDSGGRFNFNIGYQF